MVKQKYYIYFFLWFLISCVFGQVLNLGMSLTEIHPDYGVILDFEEILMLQVGYFTIWTNVLTAIWAGVNLSYLWTKKRHGFILNKSTFTMVASYNVALMLIFFGSFIVMPSLIVDFTTWWQITKSMIEHLITPVLMIVFYFLTKTSRISTKEYSLKYSWWILLMPTCYLIFAITRSFMMHEAFPDSNLRFFAYPKLDPYTSPAWQSIFLVFLALTGFDGLGVLMNFLSNIMLKHWTKVKSKSTKKKVVEANLEQNQYQEKPVN